MDNQRAPRRTSPGAPYPLHQRATSVISEG